ncbi:hypothetical protein [Bartonella koehlerae]|uniref:Uncharacterized protein n=1 Tax=Bartonella koehlerae C-29 TaxID=1134510 RepID=A0A067W951_9HYPH|nr:hypothetical protein [Bartonella koehlerae]KEC56515.1 hypothetical protein O9A_00009 [Bartonella koehlerae C-29]
MPDENTDQAQWILGEKPEPVKKTRQPSRQRTVRVQEESSLEFSHFRFLWAASENGAVTDRERYVFAFAWVRNIGKTMLSLCRNPFGRGECLNEKTLFKGLWQCCRVNGAEGRYLAVLFQQKEQR